MQHLLQDFFEYYPSLDAADKTALTTASQTGGRAAVIALLQTWATSHTTQEVKDKAAEAVALLS